VPDAPRYRLWPPVALFVPLLVGQAISARWPWPIPFAGRAPLAYALLAVFFVVNGVAYAKMLRARTGVLPGQAAQRILTTWPFSWSRNPLYVGLLALCAAIALLQDSTWSLASVPIAVALVTWGAILPEERYLAEKFGDEYLSYKTRVRRWL